MFLKKKKLFILIKDIQHSIKITIIREKKKLKIPISTMMQIRNRVKSTTYDANTFLSNHLN